jgi:hypothetical protein
MQNWWLPDKNGAVEHKKSFYDYIKGVIKIK